MKLVLPQAAADSSVLADVSSATVAIESMALRISNALASCCGVINEISFNISSVLETAFWIHLLISVLDRQQY